MSTNEQSHRHYVVIEGPPVGNPTFFVQWLSRGAQAEFLWANAKNDQCFYREVCQLETIAIIDFGTEALEFIKDLCDASSGFTLDLDDGCGAQGEIFALMVQLGFFQRAGRHYKMTVPERLGFRSLKDAMRRLIATKCGENDGIHPELFLKVLTLSEARQCLSALQPTPTTRLEKCPLPLRPSRGHAHE